MVIFIYFRKILSKTEKLIFLDEVDSVNAEAKRLKDLRVDIIVVLSHCGLDVDKIMAEKCPDIDLIVGGHSHAFLYTGKNIIYLQLLNRHNDDDEFDENVNKLSNIRLISIKFFI